MSNTTQQGIFVALEGLDGSGKTNACKFILEHVRAMHPDREVLHLIAPHKGVLRDYLLSKKDPAIPVESEIMVFAATHLEQTVNTIIPALERGAIIICDRYTESMMAYQGYGRKKLDELKDLVSLFRLDRCRPHVTVSITVSPETIAKRLAARADNNRLDDEEASFHERVSHGYAAQRAARALENNKRYTSADINNDGSLEELNAACAAWVKEYFSNPPTFSAVTLDEQKEETISYREFFTFFSYMDETFPYGLTSDAVAKLETVTELPDPYKVFDVKKSGYYRVTGSNNTTVIRTGDVYAVFVLTKPSPCRVYCNLRTKELYFHKLGVTEWRDGARFPVTMREMFDEFMD